ncbi:MAG: hypothetical protein SVY53_05885, partial [Chloroflexota bacterium]|nr:hypothetical protein [Chloroflexota bacterium]
MCSYSITITRSACKELDALDANGNLGNRLFELGSVIGPTDSRYASHRHRRLQTFVDGPVPDISPTML